MNFKFSNSTHHQLLLAASEFPQPLLQDYILVLSSILHPSLNHAVWKQLQSSSLNCLRPFSLTVYLVGNFQCPNSSSSLLTAFPTPQHLQTSEYWMDLAETKAVCEQNSCTHMTYHCSQTPVCTLLTSGPGPPASTGHPSAGSSAESACPDEDLCSVTKEERFIRYLFSPPVFLHAKLVLPLQHNARRAFATSVLQAKNVFRAE